MCIVMESKAMGTRQCYAQDQRSEVIKAGEPKLKMAMDYLGKEGRTFLVGDYPTLADFLLLETIEFYNYLSEGETFKTYPQAEAFYKRMTALPKLGEYFLSDAAKKLPFNNKIAKVN